MTLPRGNGGRFAKKDTVTSSTPGTPIVPGTSGESMTPLAPVSQFPQTAQAPATPAQAIVEARPASPTTGAKRRGRPPGSKSAPRPPASPQVAPQGVIAGDSLVGGVGAPGMPLDRFSQTGAALAGMLTGGCMMALGSEWKPTPEEMNELTKSFTIYCRSKNFPDLPPGIVLLGAVAMYALPRLSMPETKSRLQAIERRFRGAKNNPAPIPSSAPPL
jgi:hypothetical protein